MKIGTLNTLEIKTETIRLRELKETDLPQIIEIVNAYTVNATAYLYIVYYRKTEEFEDNIRWYDPTLERLASRFKVMKDKLPYSNAYTDEGKKEFNNILEYIEAYFSKEVLYSPYGPIQQEPFSNKPFEKSVNNFIHKAVITRREQKRKVFRMGITLAGKDELIGSVSFDFEDGKVGCYKTTGDLGIFIHPDYREIKNDKGDVIGKRWREVLYAVTAFIKDVFPLYYPEHQNMYISATTHPFNWATEGILDKFKFDGIRNSYEYGKRKYYAMPYNEFISTFLNKDWNKAKYNVQANTVRANEQLLDTSY